MKKKERKNPRGLLKKRRDHEVKVPGLPKEVLVMLSLHRPLTALLANTTAKGAGVDARELKEEGERVVY